MNESEIVLFQQSIATCADATEVARKVKLAFKKMPSEMVLDCFARVMTVPFPHMIKVAFWETVRYSHIWWEVDKVLKGAVMENPIVQKAFSDAVQMREWLVKKQVEGFESICMTLDSETVFPQKFVQTELHRQIYLITHFSDAYASAQLKEYAIVQENAECIKNYLDRWGNNLLWYLTYRDDQNAKGGFACPLLERELLQLGVNPNHCNDLGLCWADVRRYLVGSGNEVSPFDKQEGERYDGN